MIIFAVKGYMEHTLGMQLGSLLGASNNQMMI